MQMVCCSQPCTAWPFCRAVRSGSCALPKTPSPDGDPKGSGAAGEDLQCIPPREPSLRVHLCMSYTARSMHTLLLQRALFFSALSSPLTALSSHGVSGQHISSVSQIRQRWGWGVLRLETLQPDRNRPREPSAPWPPATHRAPARRLLVAMLTALLWGLDGGF